MCYLPVLLSKEQKHQVSSITPDIDEHFHLSRLTKSVNKTPSGMSSETMVVVKTRPGCPCR